MLAFLELEATVGVVLRASCARVCPSVSCRSVCLWRTGGSAWPGGGCGGLSGGAGLGWWGNSGGSQPPGLALGVQLSHQPGDTGRGPHRTRSAQGRVPTSIWDSKLGFLGSFLKIDF